MQVGFVEEKDKFLIKQIDRPVATEGTIVIKNHVNGVNFADGLHIKGQSPLKKAYGIVGGECAGEVVEVGEGVQNYKIGDSVLALTGNALAEYTLVQANDRRASKIPEGISFDVATAIGVQALTAYNMIEKAYKVKEGDYILVHAAAGGVGSILVQMIQNKGAIAIASTSSEEKVSYLKSLGAKHIVNYKKENLLDRVMEITNGVGVHAALDSVGNATFDISLNSLRHFGTVVIYGYASGPIPPLDLNRLMIKNTKVQCTSLWNNMLTMEESEKAFKAVFDLYKSNAYTLKITHYPFKDSLKAYEDILTGNTTGKLVINIL